MFVNCQEMSCSHAPSRSFQNSVSFLFPVDVCVYENAILEHKSSISKIRMYSQCKWFIMKCINLYVNIILWAYLWDVENKGQRGRGKDI